MKKRVEVEDLEPGMYVSELDCPWAQTPLAARGFVITTSEQIAQLKAYCTYVFVEPGMGDSEPVPPTDPLFNPSTSSHLDRPELELEILKKYSNPGFGQSKYPDAHSMKSEIAYQADDG